MALSLEMRPAMETTIVEISIRTIFAEMMDTDLPDGNTTRMLLINREPVHETTSTRGVPGIIPISV